MLRSSLYKSIKVTAYLLLITQLWSCCSNLKNTTQTLPLNNESCAVQNCISQNDTIINSSCFVKYPCYKDYYTVHIKIGGTDTILPYKFTCEAPSKIVPWYIGNFANEYLFLKRGCSNFCYILLEYKRVNSKTIIKKQVNDFIYLSSQDSLIYYFSSGNRGKEMIMVENFVSNRLDSFFVNSNDFELGISSIVNYTGGKIINFEDGSSKKYRKQ